ncbi:MAG: PAS domain S-box protein [bacterium]|nr:PAS domain S-box protein [bacterium]
MYTNRRYLKILVIAETSQEEEYSIQLLCGESDIVYQPETIDTPDNACALLHEKEFDAILMNPDFSNSHLLNLLQDITGAFPSLIMPVILINEDGKEYTAAQLTGSGKITLESGPCSHTTIQSQVYKSVENKIIAAANKESEEEIRKFKRVVEQNPSSVIITGLDGTIEYVNPKFCAVTGYSYHEVIGHNPSILKSGNQSDDFYRHLWETITSGKEWSGELHNIRKNGDSYWERASISSLKNDRGDITHYIAIKEDITDNKEILDELKKSEEKFRVIFESLGEGVAVVGLDGSIVQVNNNFVLLQGYDKEQEILGKNIFELISANDNTMIQYNMDRARDMDRSGVLEYRLLRKDGEEIDAEMSITLLKGSKETPLGYVVLVFDISERKKSDNAIRLSEAEKGAILEAIPDLMFHVNKEGKNLDPVLDAKLQSAFPESIARDVIPVITRAFDSGAIQIMEYPVLVNSVQEYYEARFIVSGIEEILVILRNVTDRKIIEEELLKAKEEAEKVSRYKSEFLANMSHEIRTPLNSILGFIDVLLRSSLDSTQSKYLSIVGSSAHNLLGIINDILDFSKIESKKLEIDITPFSLFTELEPVIDLFAEKAKEKNIELLAFIDPALPFSLLGDPLRIKQVMNNFLSNAIKFTPEEGEISVTVEGEHLSPEKIKINFSVTDNGIGIPPYKQAAIFDSFSQVDSSITRKYGGSGLGLSICQNLLELMKGTIHLKSEPGIGSTFSFEIDFDIPPENDAHSSGDLFLHAAGSIQQQVTLYQGPGSNYPEAALIKKYLKRLKYKTIDMDSIEEVSQHENIEIIIFPPLIRAMNILTSYQALDTDIPAVVIADDPGDITGFVDTHVHILYRPVTPSKIITVLGEALHKEIPGPFARDQFSSRHVSFPGARALVAEDHSVNRMLMEVMLKELQISSDFAGNGLEAFDKFKENKFDIILMDINMPVSDGIEATQMILEFEEKNALAHTPIVALTAKAMKGDRESFLEAGMDDYLAKPIESSMLKKILSHYLEDKKTVSGKIREAPKPSLPHSDRPTPLINQDEIEQIAGELDIPSDMLITLIQRFLSRSGENTSGLEEGIAAEDFSMIYHHAHKIKGAAANLRLKTVSECALQMEIHAYEEKEFPYKEHFKELVKQINTLKKQFTE